ncbi:hypothetical protein [Enterococcus faecium]|uniref:hypothetical protein n=1 Tax=Enterococcus faecium TaxID=1352 RepID=UPI000A3E5B22|nr:hypothetical protein [Enterococcus faecium]
MTEIIAEFADLYLKDTGVLIGTNSKVYQEVKEKIEAKLNPSNRNRPKNHQKKPVKQSLLEISTQQIF